MLELLLCVIGLIILITSLKLPHENTKYLRLRLLKILIAKPPKEKFRIDLPMNMEFHWKCSIEAKKLPMVLNERNQIILHAWPWGGDRLEANIEIPLSSTDDLKKLNVRAISSSFDVKEAEEPFTLHLSMSREYHYIVTPKVAEQGQLRFEFWLNETLRGFVEKSFKIGSKQYGFVLPAKITMLLTAIGVLLSMLGAILTVLKFFQ